MKHADRIGKGMRGSTAFGIAVALILGFTALCDAKTWTVTTTADSATETGSLRYIVSKAGKGDTIKFTSGGTTLTDSLTLDKKLTIEGPATLRQTGENRIFHIPADGNVTLKKLTLTGGGRSMPRGGAVYNAGDLTMKDCTITGNNATTEGGGVFSLGTLTMENCVVENNSAQYRCGGVYNGGKLEIDGGAIRSNSGDSGGEAGLYNAAGASATVTECTIMYNSCPHGAGGIKNEGTLEMKSCTIGSNNGGSCGGIESTGSLKLKKCVITGNSSAYNGGGIYLHGGGSLTAETCTVKGNSARYAGGGICHFDFVLDENPTAKCRLKGTTYVTGNVPDQICGPYKADGDCTIGSAPNKSATTFSGYSGETEPEPRSIVEDADVAQVKSDLADPVSDLFAAISDALSQDLGGISGDATALLAGLTAALYYANTFEDVTIISMDLAVEYTASWPEHVRYYALFARADGSGYELPERGVQFELKPGQSLPKGVTPPDFYEEGEGLMTWRNVVTDNASYDLNPAPGVVTFRVCSVRAAAPTSGSGGGSGGCNAGGTTGFGAFPLLIALPLVAVARRKLK